MKQYNLFTSNPMLFVLMPIALGICLGAFVYGSLSMLVVLAIAVVIVCGCFVSHRSQQYNIFSAFMFLLILLLGMLLLNLSRKGDDEEWSKSERIYRGVVTDYPHIGEKKERLSIRVVEMLDSSSCESVDRNIYLYVKGGSGFIDIGETITFRGLISSIESSGNPDAFDYASYLRRHGIEGQAFVGEGQWSVSLPSRSISFFTDLGIQARRLRHWLVSKFSASDNIDKENLAIVSAMTFGDKSMLERETKNLFSHTGASHILALSGLHLGIVYGIIQFLLLSSYHRLRHRRLREAISVLSIWLFAFLCGMSFSIVRASVMFTILSFSKIRQSGYSSLNALSLAALVILIPMPDAIFDASFQLSFLAVASIMAFMPHVSKLVERKSRIVKFIVKFVSISLVAQIGVAPITAYYFNSFPLYFILTNIIVIPFASIILFLGFVYLFLSPLVSVQSFVGQAMQMIMDFVLNILNGISSLPFATINLYPSLLTVFLCYVAILLFLSNLHRRSGRKLRLLIVTMFAIFVMEMYVHRPNSVPSQIVFYNSSGHSMIHFISDKKNSFLWLPDSVAPKALEYIETSFWKKRGLEKPTTFYRDIDREEIFGSNNVVAFRDKRVALVGDRTYEKNESNKKLSVDYLYITKHYHGKLRDLFVYYNPKVIILAPDIYNKKDKDFQDEARAMNREVYSVRSKGALIVKTDD